MVHVSFHRIAGAETKILPNIAGCPVPLTTIIPYLLPLVFSVERVMSVSRHQLLLRKTILNHKTFVFFIASYVLMSYDILDINSIEQQWLKGENEEPESETDELLLHI
jgi:hypothetical protein